LGFFVLQKNMPKIRTEDMTQFSIRMPARLREALEQLAAKEHRSLAQQINLILERHLEGNPQLPTR
jgi:hypothetical protein